MTDGEDRVQRTTGQSTPGLEHNGRDQQSDLWQRNDIWRDDRC